MVKSVLLSIHPGLRTRHQTEGERYEDYFYRKPLAGSKEVIALCIIQIHPDDL